MKTAEVLFGHIEPGQGAVLKSAEENFVRSTNLRFKRMWTNMSKPKLNLVAAIVATEGEISKMKRRHELELQPMEEALKALRNINTACERCNGQGKVLRCRACAEDDAPDPNDPRDYVVCPVCLGSGEANYSTL